VRTHQAQVPCIIPVGTMRCEWHALSEQSTSEHSTKHLCRRRRHAGSMLNKHTTHKPTSADVATPAQPATLKVQTHAARSGCCVLAGACVMQTVPPGHCVGLGLRSCHPETNPVVAVSHSSSRIWKPLDVLGATCRMPAPCTADSAVCPCRGRAGRAAQHSARP